MVCLNSTFYFTRHHTIHISVVTWICLIGTPAIVLIGIFGNAISFLIFRKRALRSSSHFYFCALVIADSCTLVFGFLIEAWLREYVKEAVIKRTLMANHMALHRMNRSAAPPPQAAAFRSAAMTFDGSLMYVCLPSVFMRTAVQTASVYLLIVFTATRTLVIVRPLQGAVWATVSNAKKCVYSVLVVSFLMASGITIYHASANLCDPLVANDIIDLVFLSLLPSVLLLVFNCIIICTIYRREKSSALELHTEMKRLHVGGITRRLLIVTIAFIVLEIPFAIYKVYVHLYNMECLKNGYIYKDIERTLRLLSNINYSVNFLLYCVSGEQFRTALARTLRIGCRKRVDDSAKQAKRRSRRQSSRYTGFALTSTTTYNTTTTNDKTTREFRSVSPLHATLQDVDNSLQLELETYEVEYFKVAESELNELCISPPSLHRSVSVPAFVHLALEIEHKAYFLPKLSRSIRHHDFGNNNNNNSKLAASKARAKERAKTKVRQFASRNRSHSLSCGSAAKSTHAKLAAKTVLVNFDAGNRCTNHTYSTIQNSK